MGEDSGRVTLFGRVMEWGNTLKSRLTKYLKTHNDGISCIKCSRKLRNILKRVMRPERPCEIGGKTENYLISTQRQLHLELLLMLDHDVKNVFQKNENYSK